jgi:UDP-N-acetylmuramoyl-tripeptide--D-alanyl-D-alanine ligase
MSWTCTLGELARAIGAPVPHNGAAARTFSAVSTDTRSLRPGDVFFALSGENFDGNTFVPQAFEKGAVAAVCEQPVPGGLCVVAEEPVRRLQDFAAWHRTRCAANVIAITGSSGKTTAKDLVAALLASKYPVVKTQGNLNNDIGCPLSLLLMDENTRHAVIEMGANHAGEIAGLCRIARPDEAAVTIVAPAHLEGFGTIEGIARAKAEIVTGLARGGMFYVNVDNPWCLAMAARHDGPKMYFGAHGDVVLRSCAFDDAGEMVLDIDPVGVLRLPLAVRAHATNVLLAVAVAMRHGIVEIEGPLRAACAALSRFKTLAVGPLTVLDDSYNANPASMTAALEALADRRVDGARMAVLGEMLELGAAARDLHREVGRAAARFGVAHLFAYGPHGADMAAGALEAGVPHAEALDDHGAIALAVRRVAAPGDALLVKGSRGVRMETVIEALKRMYDGG